MARQIANLNLTRPGGFGLNLQNSGDVLPGAWATKALNCVFDNAGRLSSRLGYQEVVQPITDEIRSVAEHTDLAGNSELIAACANSIVWYNGLTPTSAVSGGITGNGNWQFTNFNGKMVGFERDQAPIVRSAIGGVFAPISGTDVPTGTNTVLAAGGRLYTIENATLKYCDLLDETTWGGEIDLSRNWPAGGDVGVALAEWNGNIIVFGENSIVILNDPTGALDPNNLEIVESLSNVGCIARDSLQSIGTDLFFLSRQGVLSLGRVVQEKSLPVNKVSTNVNDEVIDTALSADLDRVKAVFSGTEEFYLLSFASEGRTFVFDTRRLNPDQSVRVTEWDFTPSASIQDRQGRLLLASGPSLSRYTGYQDALSLDSLTSTSYELEYASGWNDFGEQIADRIKIPKRLTIRALGGNGDSVDYSVAYDYSDLFSIETQDIPAANVSEWGEFEWGEGEWSGGAQFNETSTSAGGSGRVIKVGVSKTINGEVFAINQVGLAAKLGRVVI